MLPGNPGHGQKAGLWNLRATRTGASEMHSAHGEMEVHAPGF